MRGTVLSVSVLSVGLGIVLAAADVVDVDPDEDLFQLVELALILTLFADGLIVERELLAMHWGPPARAMIFAMPLTLGLIALIAAALFPGAELGRGVPARGGAHADRPGRHVGGGHRARVPSRVRHTLNLESGLNDGLALPFVLFFLVLATARRRRGQRGAPSCSARPRSGPCWASFSGSSAGASIAPLPGGGITGRYEGIYAIGLGLAAYGLADVTFGNGLIAAFVAGIALGPPSTRSRIASPTSPRTSARSSRS